MLSLVWTFGRSPIQTDMSFTSLKVRRIDDASWRIGGMGGRVQEVKNKRQACYVTYPGLNVSW